MNTKNKIEIDNYTRCHDNILYDISKLVVIILLTQIWYYRFIDLNNIDIKLNELKLYNLN